MLLGWFFYTLKRVTRSWRVTCSQCPSSPLRRGNKVGLYAMVASFSATESDLTGNKRLEIEFNLSCRNKKYYINPQNVYCINLKNLLSMQTLTTLSGI